MHRILTIALLECDTPSEKVQKVHGSYGDMFKALFAKGLKRLPEDVSGTNLRYVYYDVVKKQEYPDPEQVDGILLTGSKYCAFENEPWIVSLTEYVRTVLKQHSTKLVGICFGHQIIGRAAGAQVGQSPGGWEIAVLDTNLSEYGAKLFGKPKLTLHQMHRDAVLTVPDKFINLGSSDRCSIQGLHYPGRAFTLQAHPEFNGFIISCIVNLRHELGVFDDEMTKEALSRADLKNDDLLCGELICKFLIDN